MSKRHSHIPPGVRIAVTDAQVERDIHVRGEAWAAPVRRLTDDQWTKLVRLGLSDPIVYEGVRSLYRGAPQTETLVAMIQGLALMHASLLAKAVDAARAAPSVVIVDKGKPA